MKEAQSKEPGTGFEILKSFLRAEMIITHARKVRSWPWWARVGHRLIVGWRCPACVAFKNGEHESWGLKL